VTTATRAWVLSGLLLASAADRLAADVFTNLLPAADTCLFESDPNNNLGAFTNVPVGTTAVGKRSRGVIRFDLTVIPTNATVVSASMTLQMVKRPAAGAASSVGLNRLLVPWGEGHGNGQIGQPAASGEASWTNRMSPSTPWMSPGGAAGTDFVPQASASIAGVDQLGSYMFASTAGLVSDAQMWVSNPTTNFGWMLLCQNEGTSATARRFGSRESTTPPVLALQYTLATNPPPPNLSIPVLQGDQIQFSFDAEANATYVVEARAALDGSPWTTLTNVPALPTPATIFVSAPSTNASRFCRVRSP
jgi:hypothetical protein